jgi:hypothetical protein
MAAPNFGYYKENPNSLVETADWFHKHDRLYTESEDGHFDTNYKFS